MRASRYSIGPRRPAGRLGASTRTGAGDLSRLQRHEVVVVVAGDAAVAADQHEPAFRLRLLGPRVRQRAPARLEFRQPVAVAADGDRMLVDLDAGRLVDHARHLDRRLAAHVPGAQRGAVAEIVEQAAAAAGLAVPPRRRLLRFDRVARHFHLVGEMEQRTAIAAIVVDFDQLADRALVDQPLGGVVGWRPCRRPVDGQPPAALLHRLDHPAGIGDAGGKRLFDHDVQPAWRDRLDRVGMCRCRRADDGEIGPCRCQAGIEVDEDPLLGDAEIVDGALHPRAVRIEDAGNLGIRMLRHLAQQIAHMHVVEADAEHAVFRHPATPWVERTQSAERAQASAAQKFHNAKNGNALRISAQPRYFHAAHRSSAPDPGGAGTWSTPPPMPPSTTACGSEWSEADAAPSSAPCTVWRCVSTTASRWLPARCRPILRTPPPRPPRSASRPTAPMPTTATWRVPRRRGPTASRRSSS